jgi:hypothetical protein
MASPDAQQMVFVPLKPCRVSDSEHESLAARWHGREFQGAGVIGRLADGRIATTLKGPFDQIQLGALLPAFTDYCETTETQRVDDSVERCERLYVLNINGNREREYRYAAHTGRKTWTNMGTVFNTAWVDMARVPRAGV